MARVWIPDSCHAVYYFHGICRHGESTTKQALTTRKTLPASQMDVHQEFVDRIVSKVHENVSKKTHCNILADFILLPYLWFVSVSVLWCLILHYSRSIENA